MARPIRNTPNGSSSAPTPKSGAAPPPAEPPPPRVAHASRVLSRAERRLRVLAAGRAERGEPLSPETSSASAPKPPQPGTPEYWDYVEEEPFPRNLSTCIITPGRQKYFATLWQTQIPYTPGPDDPDPTGDQPYVHPTPEQRETSREAFFQLQDHYFSFPKDQRIPFLHQLFQMKYGKILPEHAPTDAPSDAAVCGMAVAGCTGGATVIPPEQSHTTTLQGSSINQQLSSPKTSCGIPEIQAAASKEPGRLYAPPPPPCPKHDSFAPPQQSKSTQNCPEISTRRAERAHQPYSRVRVEMRQLRWGVAGRAERGENSVSPANRGVLAEPVVEVLVVGRDELGETEPSQKLLRQFCVPPTE